MGRLSASWNGEGPSPTTWISSTTRPSCQATATWLGSAIRRFSNRIASVSPRNTVHGPTPICRSQKPMARSRSSVAKLIWSKPENQAFICSLPPPPCGPPLLRRQPPRDTLHTMPRTRKDFASGVASASPVPFNTR